MPRRTIKDLVARYRLEPTLRDVYVEGRFDERILRLFFRESMCDRPSINLIDFVDIPDEVLSKYNATRGEKAELLALAAEIYSSSGEIQGFSAVVDADFDRLLKGETNNPLVFLTDFSCMEMYWLEESTVRKFFTWIGENDKDHSTLLRDIGAVAKDLFLLRGAIISLNLKAAMIPIRKYCKNSECRISIDIDRYSQSVLMAAGVSTRHADLNDERSRLDQEVDSDQRNRTNGHDLVELVFLAYRNKLGHVGIIDSRGVETVIRMTLPIHKLNEHLLFQQLLRRAC